MKRELALCSKVLGLILFFIGLVLLLNHLAALLFLSDFPGGGRLRSYQLVTLFIQGIVPMLVGFFLIKYAGVVVAICYPPAPTKPGTRRPTGRISQRRRISRPQAQPDERHDPDRRDVE